MSDIEKLAYEIMILTFKSSGASNTKMVSTKLEGHSDEFLSEVSAMLKEFGTFRGGGNYTGYTLSEKGIEFIRHGGYDGERKRLKQQKINLFLGWFGTGIGIVGGIMGISSILYQCAHDGNNPQNHKANTTTETTENINNMNTDTTHTKPDIFTISSSQSYIHPNWNIGYDIRNTNNIIKTDESVQ